MNAAVPGADYENAEDTTLRDSVHRRGNRSPDDECNGDASPINLTEITDTGV